MSKRAWVATIALLFVAPAFAHAQETSADVRIQAALEAASSAGIPRSLLESKIAEGQARGAATERIAAAVEARLAGLMKAREALARAGLESSTEAELSVSADAMRSGVSVAALTRISETAPQERRVVAIAVLTELVALGRAPEEAVIEVTAALERGPDALAAVRADVHGQLQARGMRGVQLPAEVGAQIQLRTQRPQP